MEKSQADPARVQSSDGSQPTGSAEEEFRALRDQLTTAIQARQQAERAREEAEGELRMIDSIMARRPALDQPTRWENVQKAITMAGKADEAIRQLTAAEQARAQAEQQVGELLQSVQARTSERNQAREAITTLEGLRAQAEQERDALKALLRASEPSTATGPTGSPRTPTKGSER
jgi:chromosome segregation ATPase